MRFLFLLCLIVTITASASEEIFVPDYSHAMENALAMQNFFSGFGEGFSNAVAVTVDDFRYCFYGFYCIYDSILDCIEELKEIKEFDLNKVFEVISKYFIGSLTQCAMPCFIPGAMIYRLTIPLFNMSLEGLQQALLFGLALGIQDLMADGYDLIKSLVAGDFHQVGRDLGDMLWVLIAK